MCTDIYKELFDFLYLKIPWQIYALSSQNHIDCVTLAM
jgi:hypothetical protein